MCKQQHKTIKLPKLPQYTLGVGEKAKQRLNILNGIYNEASKDFLHQAGLTKGMSVLEVGCGNGIMTCWQAREVGSHGHVCAVDISPKQLQVTKRLAEQEGLRNISFHQLDAHHLATLGQNFSFVSTRFVLAHLNEPEKVFEAMLSVLSPDGILACEEAKTSDHACNPQNQAFNRYYEIWSHLRTKKGADPEYGLVLSTLFKKHGLEVKYERHTTRSLPIGQLREIFPLNLEETREQVINCQLSNDAEISRLIVELYNLVNDSRYEMRFSGSIQIAGKKATPGG